MQGLEVPALGRPAKLGMLYNLRRDRLIPGISLWDDATLKTNVGQTQQGGGCHYTVSLEDSITTKSYNLGIKSHLKLSLLGGMLEAGGAAKYIYDRTSSEQQARVTLTYSSTTHFEQMTMEQISHIEHPTVFEDTEATHVVIGIDYGVEANFIFDQYCTSNETIHDALLSMEVSVKAIPKPTATISASAKSSSKKKKMTCTFYGDVSLSCIPSTYEEAISAYKELITLQENRSIPKKIYLHPLCRLNTLYKHQPVIFSVNELLTTQIEEIMEYLHETEIKCQDLKKIDGCVIFATLDKQITTFMKFLHRFKGYFTGQISRLVPEVRCSGREVELEEFLQSVHRSPFNEENLENYITDKRRELRILNEYREHKIPSCELKVLHIFSNEQEQLDALIHNISYKQIICFALNVTSEKIPLMETMHSYLTIGNISSVRHSEWFKNQTIRSALINKKKKFLEFIDANKHIVKCAFVVCEKSIGIEENTPTLIRYANGNPEVFDPPPAPINFQVEHKDDDAVKLTWSMPEGNDTDILSYCIHYRKRNKTEWRTKSTEQNMVTIAGLRSDSEYHFKVRGCHQYGVTPQSTTIKAKTDQYRFFIILLARIVHDVQIMQSRLLTS